MKPQFQINARTRLRTVASLLISSLVEAKPDPAISVTPATSIPKAARTVLIKIANTVVASEPGHTPGTYTSDSCYGKVAHSLRGKSLDKNWFILLFFAGSDESKIAHACLYTNHGVRVVDTFNGNPAVDHKDGHIYYQVAGEDSHAYPLAACVTLAKFQSLFLPHL